MLTVAYRIAAGQTTGVATQASHAPLGSRTRRVMQSCAAESLVQDLLEIAVDRPSVQWKLARNDDGRPALAGLGAPNVIEVSLSHSGLFALAAITDLGQIGVDLEYRVPERSIYELANYAFGRQEQGIVESEGPVAFYRIWTLREALAKACGIGFPMLADGRDYFSNAPNSGIWQTTIDGRQWLFLIGDLSDDYAFAIAFASRSALKPNCLTNLRPRRFDSQDRDLGSKTPIIAQP